MLLDVAARRADFRALHDEGCFLLPAAWDVGGAQRLEALGYAGFATTNTSLAWTLSRNDRRVTRDEVLAHLRQLVNATEIAVNGDFEAGFATDTIELEVNVRLAIDTGIAALSITDLIADELDDLSRAVDRIRASRRAIATSGEDVLLVARADGFLSRHASVSDTIQRLVAYSKAGADVLCAPGVSDPTAIKTMVLAVAPKALDVQLMEPGLSATDLGELGVRRVSVGNSFAEAAWASFERVAQRFIDRGDLAPETSFDVSEAAE